MPILFRNLANKSILWLLKSVKWLDALAKKKSIGRSTRDAPSKDGNLFCQKQGRFIYCKVVINVLPEIECRY